ncbi:NfeD family protein [Methyloceanibacter caenitepidi]|uniref:Putative activity regulator of membrane protease YbbK n=1 Tax=Methyloceanibacter caenitepidi TaxID=1384459 RepID=A0A0A8K7P2_9HYPH|nr:NfeD family protein [Methyloceanibacter caenitepidi]BAQ18567.1 putative activity regulator of membrane protease YbbK [Methyloceanibacter caenitepidi]
MMETIVSLGPWVWLILAAVLLVLEMLAPGIFLMWFGLAAILTGVIALRYEIAWQWQLIWFCSLSLVTVILVNRYLRRNPLESDAPLLNQRAAQLIGETHELVDPIANGRGSVRVGDTIWRVEGPALPKGAQVTVVGADGSILKVEPAKAEAANS